MKTKFLIFCSLLCFVSKVCTEELAWYQGCFTSDTSKFGNQQAEIVNTLDLQTDLVLGQLLNDTVVGCARKCYKERYLYFAISVQEPCHCMNGVETLVKVEDVFCRSNSSAENRTESQNFPPVSNTDGFQTVYFTDGPYINKVTLTLDQEWIVVNTAVVLKVTVEIPKLLNITSDSPSFLEPITVSVNRETSHIISSSEDLACQNPLTEWTGDQLYTVIPENETVFVRIPHMFTAVGEQSVVVRVSNELSTLLSQITVTVQQPEPRDLQVVIQTEETNRPSCIPESFVFPQNATIFAIFVNAEFVIEASVANGNNLTFTYVTADENNIVKEVSDRPCDLTCEKWSGDGSETCRDSFVKMVLTTVGVYRQAVEVENVYGHLSKTLYLVVMEDKLAGLNFTLQSESTLFLPGKAVIFLVTMEIRSRFNTSLEVKFYKDHSHYATLEDSNTTSLSIKCNQGEMMIVSTYGKGCVLAVQFEHVFYVEGFYLPEVVVSNNKDVSINFVLSTNLMVMNRLQGARLQSDRIVPLNQNTKITLHLTVSSVNLSVSWIMVNEYGFVVENKSTVDPLLMYRFSALGQYHIHCTAWNVMGSVSANTTIQVEEPISGLQLSCGDKFIIRTDYVVNCISQISSGKDVRFDWKMFNEFYTISGDIKNDNTSSAADIVFERPGMYNISVSANNSVSKAFASLLITVEIPLNFVVILQKEPNILGKETDLKIITSQNSDKDVQLEFDFGKGREQYNYTYEISKNAYYLEYLFDEPGVHDVMVYAFNRVSMVTGSVEAVVEKIVDSLEIWMKRAPALGIPAIFVLKTEGQRSDLFYIWEFSDGTQTMSSSPVISKTFSTPGSHTINVTAKNLVSEYKTSLQVEVAEALVGPILLHDTMVTVSKEVKFTLKGDDVDFDILQADYGNGYKQAIEKSSDVTSDTDIRWSYVYNKSGLYTIYVHILGGAGASREPVESWIMVEEPVTELRLMGPSVVEMQGLFLHQEWRAVAKTGTNIVYQWDLGGEMYYTTHNKFIRGFDLPGTHELKVIAINDVSREESNITVTVQYPIVHLKISADTVILGQSTAVSLLITGGREFFIHMTYGDSQTEIFSSQNVSLAIKVIDPPERGMPKYQVTLNHKYHSVGSYEITANVSNLVSHKIQSNSSKVHEPIDGVHVTTDSPAMLPVGHKVDVKATVASGKNLQFDWNFSDSYPKPSVVSSGNTSIATHEFEVTGDYEVSVRVSNQYQKPVVAKLPFKFKVVEEINDLSLIEVKQRKKAVLMGTKPDWLTEEVTFSVMCRRGSHLTFIFHFGDGNSKAVDGLLNKFNYYIGAQASHRYTKEGVFPVHVTAVNPLGNVTVYLKEPFYVQRPPLTPKLKSSYYIEYGQNFTFKVGPVDDADVTFDWKFGDQTDVVNSNASEMTHLYQKAGVYDLVVIAKNRGTKTTANAKVYVEHRIQGVTLNLSSTIVDASEMVKMSAEVFPRYNNLAAYYTWRIGQDTRDTKDSYLEYNFKAGRYPVTVTAYNGVSNATSTVAVLHVLSKLESLDIALSGNPIIGQQLKFIATFYRGSELTFTWNFGDGSPVVEMNNSKYIEHVYSREGIYSVELQASNLISQASQSRRLFVLDRICLPPVIFIHDKSFTKVTRSHRLQYEVAVTSAVCENTIIAAKYHWTLFNSTNNYVIDLPSVSEHVFQQKRLILEPCLLNVGLYRLEVKVEIKDTIVYSTDTIEIQVLPSSLDVVIKGGAVREITRQDDIVWDGSLSENSDCLDNALIKYNWTCSKSFVSSESCFKDNVTDGLSLDQAVVMFPANLIVQNLKEFLVTLTVWSNEQHPQTALQVIKISDKPRSLKLSIHCPQCEKNVINANDRLMLQAVCSGCPDDVTYHWTTHFVYKNLSLRHQQENISCTVKRPDGSNFNLWTLPIEKNTSDMYKSLPGDSTIDKGDNSIVHSSLLDNDIRTRRSSAMNSLTLTIPPMGEDGSNMFNGYPFGIPSIAENTYSSRRGNRQKDIKGNSRGIQHYSSRDPFLFKMGTDVIQIREGLSQQEHSRTNPSQVGQGIVSGGTDRVYVDGNRKDDITAREKHTLEKSSNVYFFRDSQTTTGTDKQSLVIKPYYFREGFEYIIKVKARFRDGHTGGTAMTTFTVNSSPSKGVCEISLNSGIELVTEFRLYCHEWKDENKPLQYEVSFSYEDDGIKYVIYRGLQHDVNFTLPAGDRSKNYKVMVYISVLDDRLARTSVCRYPLEVRPFSLESGQHMEDFVYNHSDSRNIAGRLNIAKRQGDDHQIKAIIHILGRCLYRLVSTDTVQYNTTTFKKSVDRMLDELRHLSMRDEIEILQTVQAIESLVTVTKEFDMAALKASVNLMKKIGEKVREFSPLVINEDLFMLLHTITSSLIQSLSEHQQHEGAKQRNHHEYLEKIIQVQHFLLQKEMTYHTMAEGEITRSSALMITKAGRYTLHDRPVMKINQSKIVLPENMELVLKKDEFERLDADLFAPNQNCYQVHMTKYNFNPYSYDRHETNKIQSDVCSLKVFTCNGSQVNVKNLDDDNLVQIEIPRISDKNEMFGFHQLQKSVMNIHNFNMTRSDRHNSLNIEIELVPVTQGRLFPIAVMINYKSPPTPSHHITKQEVQGNHFKLFLPAGFLNFSGEYYIGILDAGLNKGRPRQGEITLRNYTLKLWWNKCLFWNETIRHWSDHGCWATEKSTFNNTHCKCNHLTTFGSHFELIPNDLSHISVEDFFDLNENPVTVCLTGAILLLYGLLMVLCHKLDIHDAKKGGITYLIDNNLGDKQKYEITIETGFRKGAGTTAKISVILHGEEGMSETRELISDDDRLLFERNSRDKFIMTLPDSIGKIWKVQLWHNNHGSSPSWYLSRVIVKDLNSGSTYYFISEKWLAVEEDDGKVEREFMALEGNLGFRKVFWAKGTQYLSDYHLWMSLFTRPSYSQFNRKQRLTCCLTLLMMYMCLNAMWYKEFKPEYRGEFGLLDVSLRNITVGAICCAIVVPLNLLIVLLFRRSKMQQSGNLADKIHDEEKEDEEFASGKPNEHAQEEEEVESVQPIMTYSILDQSILNWPSIQDWAQKQWVKRHQGYQETSNSPGMSNTPNQLVHRRILGSEIDQASSGFEDSNSTDPRRQVTISSLNSSQKIKAPSVSSAASNKVPNKDSSTRKTVGNRLFLPYWCQFIAWFLCAVIICTCVIFTILYGFRFGISKSIMWLQSLYFSFMVCVFIMQPFTIILAVIYTAIRYKNDPSILDHYEDGDFGEKAKLEILRRKKEQTQVTEQEELDRGVAARQRSRYLRFARPPQEKQLIEARKKIMKEKKAMSLIRDTTVVLLMFTMLCVMAYGKDTSSPFYINESLKNSLIRSGPVKFNGIKLGSEWYQWSQTAMLDALYPLNSSHLGPDSLQGYHVMDNSFIIGQVQARQLKVIREDCHCPYDLPLLPEDCFLDYQSSNQMKAKNNLTEYQTATSSFRIFGKHGVYDNSGYVLKLNKTRSEVLLQLKELQRSEWINSQTRAIIVEYTLYNAPTNLFTSVVILLEIPSSGGAYPGQRIRSTHLYRYVSNLDNLVLAFELLFIILTVYKIGVQLCDVFKVDKYFHDFWAVLDTIFSGLSLTYIVFYIYRFILVSETVESLRSTYFKQFVDISFLAFWDEIIRCLVGMILFLVTIKFLRLLHYNKVLSLFGTVYKRVQKEIVVFMGLFLGSILIFSRIGHVLFGAFYLSFSDTFHSILTVSALLTGVYEDYSMADSSVLHTMRIFVLFCTVFGIGLLTSYMVAVLSSRFRMQKHKHSVFLVMKPKETILFYWQTFLFWTGIMSAPVDEEPDNVLPPEFTMAEVEYQVDELFFRINTLTGSHGLPEKPTSYFTDSDGTYGHGDDGISSGGSEVNLDDDDRLENRVHKIEDSLCSHEPYLAQLLKLNQNERMTKGREKQIRSHLEMEIFRQLQNQRSNVQGKVVGDSSKSSATTSGSSSEMATPFGDRKSGEKMAVGVLSNQQNTFVHHAEISPLNDTKNSPYQARRSTTSSSSNPDSPDEQIKNIERLRLLNEKGVKKSTKPEEQTAEATGSKNMTSKIVKKPEPPHKPTFHNPGLRDVQVQDTNKSSVLNSPALRQLRSSLQAIERDRHSFKGESGSSIATESSSGSEQDAIHGKACAQLKRNLRKTKSRGKGKGSVNLTSVLLDDLDTSNDELGGAGTPFKISETEPILEQESTED